MKKIVFFVLSEICFFFQRFVRFVRVSELLFSLSVTGQIHLFLDLFPPLSLKVLLSLVVTSFLSIIFCWDRMLFTQQRTPNVLFWSQSENKPSNCNEIVQITVF